MAVLHLPDRLPTESLEAIHDTVQVLGDARSRLGNFAEEVRSELGDLREQLVAIHAELEEELRDLQERTLQFEAERSAFEKECQSTEQLSVKLVATQSRLEQSQSQLASMQSELESAQARLQDTELDRDVTRQQLREVTEEMSALSELVDLVKTTHEELLLAQSESRSARQRIRDECEAAFRSELESLRQRTHELERELAAARLSAQTLGEQLQQQEAELQAYREQWSRELDRVQALLDARAQLIDHAIAREKKTSSQASSPPSEDGPAAQPKPPTRRSGAAPSPEPSPKPDPEVAVTVPYSKDPVIGSVLAEFAKLSGG